MVNLQGPGALVYGIHAFRGGAAWSATRPVAPLLRTVNTPRPQPPRDFRQNGVLEKSGHHFTISLCSVTGILI